MYSYLCVESFDLFWKHSKPWDLDGSGFNNVAWKLKGDIGITELKGILHWAICFYKYFIAC